MCSSAAQGVSHAAGCGGAACGGHCEQLHKVACSMGHSSAAAFQRHAVANVPVMDPELLSGLLMSPLLIMCGCERALAHVLCWCERCVSCCVPFYLLAPVDAVAAVLCQLHQLGVVVRL